MPTTPTALTTDIAVLPDASGSEHNSSVTALSSGGFVVTYSSSVGGADRPYFRLFDADGVAVGSPVQLSAAGSIHQVSSAAQLANGDLIVHYWDGSAVMLQRVASDTGALIGPSFAVPGTASGGLQALDNGGFAYLSYFNNGSTRLTFFDAAGTQVAALAPSGHHGAMTVLDNGNLFIAFTDASASNIIGRLYSPAGSQVGVDFDISQFDISVSHVSVATLADGRVVVAFKDANAGLSNDVAFRIMNADGTASTNQISVVSLAGRQESPSVVALNDGGFVVEWGDLTGADGSGEGLLARRYDSSGALVGDTFVIAGDPAGSELKVGYQAHPMAQLTSGNLVFVFGDPGAGGYDVEVRLFAVDGNPPTPTAITMDGTAAGETLDGGALDDVLNGLGGQDILNGLGGDDLLDGGDLSDILNGGDGADDLIGGGGGDILNGDAGDDLLDGGDGSDKLNGGAGADQLTGGLGNDRMSGGDDVDTLTGGDGNDYLDGGAGLDIMTGGAGNDVYIVSDAGEVTAEVAGEGYDIVRADLTWTLASDIEGLELQGVANLEGTGNAGANNLQGNAGDNTLSGLAGVDTINGNDGDDIIIGGLGNDLLRGGLGADAFTVNHVASGVLETDQIYDFSAAEGDYLDLTDAFAGTLVEVAAFSKVAGQMTVSLVGGNTVVKLDLNGDGKADYQVKINGDVTADSGGWML